MHNGLSSCYRHGRSKLLQLAWRKESPDGDCGRCQSCRAAPPVKAGPSGPVVPGPSRQPPRFFRVRWPRRPPPHRSPYIYSRLDHLLSRRTRHRGPSTRQPEIDRRCRPRAWSALACPTARRGREEVCVTSTGINHSNVLGCCLAFLAYPSEILSRQVS